MPDRGLSQRATGCTVVPVATGEQQLEGYGVRATVRGGGPAAATCLHAWEAEGRRLILGKSGQPAATWPRRLGGRGPGTVTRARWLGGRPASASSLGRAAQVRGREIIHVLFLFTCLRNNKYMCYICIYIHFFLSYICIIVADIWN